MAAGNFAPRANHPLGKHVLVLLLLLLLLQSVGCVPFAQQKRTTMFTMLLACAGGLALAAAQKQPVGGGAVKLNNGCARATRCQQGSGDRLHLLRTCARAQTVVPGRLVRTAGIRRLHSDAADHPGP